jgi:hypothetical protein
MVESSLPSRYRGKQRWQTTPAAAFQQVNCRACQRKCKAIAEQLKPGSFALLLDAKEPPAQELDDIAWTFPVHAEPDVPMSGAV